MQQNLFGNPPYLGSSVQNEDQKDDMKYIFTKRLQKYKNLDYISCWFFKATEFSQDTNSRYAFVSTNSIFQGEQVGLLWPKILKIMRIIFAYHSFKWHNLAKNNAGVTVVIVGLAPKLTAENIHKYIFLNGGLKVTATNINAYLVDGPSVIIPRTSNLIYGLPKMIKGSQPSDGGNLILTSAEKEKCEKNISPEILRRYIGAKDYLNGFRRYCLWLNKESFQKNQNNEFISNRVSLVKQFRENAKSSVVQKGSNYPWEDNIAPDLLDSKNVIVAAHGNSLRALTKYISTSLMKTSWTLKWQQVNQLFMNWMTT